MPAVDLATQISLLNQQATELLQKYDQSFTRLDEKSQEYATQLTNQIQDYLNQLETAKTNSINEITLKLSDAIRQLNEIVETNAFTRVVSKPSIAGGTTASIGYDTTWTVSAESYLDDNVSIKEFQVDWGDGNTETVQAVNNQATISHIYTGTEGETKTITVIAIDQLNNKSETLSYQITLVNNQPPDASNLIVQGFIEVNGDLVTIENVTREISFTGAIDPEGQTVFYDITDSGILTPSKTQDIADGEIVSIQAPSATSDTPTQLKVIAKDETGLISPEKTFNVIVKKTDYGIADIFGDGSILAYFPFKSNLADLTGNIKLGWYNWGDNNESPRFSNNGMYVSNYRGCYWKVYIATSEGYNTTQTTFNLGTRFTISLQILIPSGYAGENAFTLTQSGNYSGVTVNGAILDRFEFKKGSTAGTWLFGVGGAGATVSGGYNWGNVYFEKTLQEGRIYTLTASRDGANVSAYINGSQVFSGNINADATVDTVLAAINGNIGGCWSFGGYIRNVRFFNRPISQTEAQILANET